MADFQGTGGDDVLIGTSADDTVFAGAGDDLVLGGAGADTLDGGAGQDTLAHCAGHAAGPGHRLQRRADGRRGRQLEGRAEFSHPDYFTLLGLHTGTPTDVWGV